MFYKNAKEVDVHMKLVDAIKKAVGTRVSRAVPHLSTHLALNRLTSEFGWDPVHLA